jgi:hypothetical protein
MLACLVVWLALALGAMAWFTYIILWWEGPR